MIAGHRLERKVVTREPAETRALATALAAAARPGDLISLIGDLGAGKTQFAKGFGVGLGIEDTIVSPSFSCVLAFSLRRSAVSTAYSSN